MRAGQSVMRLVTIASLLVAHGVINGAFTLHG